MTESDRRRLEKLGLANKKTSIEETLEILESLKAERIDVTKIQRTIKEDGKTRVTYLYEIQVDNIEEIISKLGLDRNYPIGARMISMLQSYKGKDSLTITETDKTRIEALGLIKKEKHVAEELLNILESLKAEGIDVTKIQQTIRVNGEERGTYLYEIPDDNIEKVIKKLGLERNYPIGSRLIRMLQAYKGNLPIKIAETDKKKIEELGLIRKEKTATEKLLDILESLKAEGIDVTKIKFSKREKNGNQRSLYLYEIQDENIEEIIKKLGLNGEYPIGQQIRTMLRCYKGQIAGSMTESDIERIEALGLASELEKKEAEQNRLKRKQQKTKKLKSQVKQELLEKENDNLNIGDSDE